MLVQLLSGRKEISLGSLAPRRDLTFVADTAEGFVRAGTAEAVEGEVIQLGAGRSVSVGELFEIARSTLGRDAVPIQDTMRIRPSASEVMELLSDPAVAHGRLGWAARVPLEDGIRQTADWLASRLELYRPDHYHV